MDQYQNKQTHRFKRSRPAFFILVLMGCAIIFFALALIACAFTINYAEDFQVSGDGGIEEKVLSRFNYTQYWAGIPFLITGVLVLFAGIWQRSRGLTITTVIFCYISVALTLLVLAVDSGNFSEWNGLHRNKLYWDSKSGYSCKTDGGSCKCTKSGASPDKEISDYECDEISELSALYGVVIGSSVIVTLFSLFTVIIITKTMTWKRLRYVQHMYYPDEFYMPNRQQPSVVEVPTLGREDYPDKYGAYNAAPHYKQTIYRNYPAL